MKYIKGLDAVRTIAIVFVIITHWGPHHFKSVVLNFILTKMVPDGMFGVDMFYVLSGYLITNILLTAREECGDDNKRQIIKNFYIRRVLRIFPIYFLYVFVMAYVLNDRYVKDNILYFITYTTDFLAFKDGARIIMHTWSLAVEEQFYLIWPWFIIYLPKKYLLSTILAAISIGIISTLVLYYVYGYYSLYLPLPCIGAFGAGALYAYTSLYPHLQKRIMNLLKILFPVCIVLFFVSRFGYSFILVRYINTVISLTLIIYVSRQQYNGITNFLFNNKLLINIGKISYGIYLYHLALPGYYNTFIVFLQRKIHFSTKILNRLIMPPAAYLIHLALVFLIATLSYQYIELAFLRLKKYFQYTNHQKTATNHAGLIS